MIYIRRNFHKYVKFYVLGMILFLVEIMDKPDCCNRLAYCVLERKKNEKQRTERNIFEYFKNNNE